MVDLASELVRISHKVLHLGLRLGLVCRVLWDGAMMLLATDSFPLLQPPSVSAAPASTASAIGNTGQVRQHVLASSLTSVDFNALISLSFACAANGKTNEFGG